MQLTLKDKVQNNRLSTASMKPVQDATSNNCHTDSGKKIVYHFKCEICGNDYTHKGNLFNHLDWHAATHTIVNSATKFTTLNLHL